MSSVPTASQRKYSARAFARGGMACPHCRRELPEPAENCPRCEFSLARCKETFPFQPPPLDLLLDPAQLLPEDLPAKLARPYRKFRKRFPQIHLSFCVVKLHPALKIRDFAFWLHNSAPDADLHRAWTILLVCDLATGHLTLSPGFALEPFLRNDALETALQELAACISEAAWDEGLTGFLRDCSRCLQLAWSNAEERRRRIDAHANGQSPPTP